MEKTLRVGFASVEDAANERSWSGTPAHILKMLRETPGVQVELISPLGQKLKWIYGPRKWMAQRRGEHFNWKREAWSLRHFAAVIERRFRARSLDVVFSTSSIPCTQLRPEIPVVFWTDATIHGMKSYYRENLSAHSERASRLQEETAIKKARFACYASNWAAGEARKLTNPERVKVLPLGPNLAVKHSAEDVSEWIRERTQRVTRRCTLLLVGVEWERKGVDIAVETARHLNDAGIEATLKIVGCTPPAGRARLYPFVEVLGRINKNAPDGYRRLVELYRTADVFVLPSRAEAFGVAVAEAAAFGLPALVCRTGGLTETVRDGESGFLLPLEDDGSQFAECARKIVLDYERFARNAYADYETRMNWRTSVDGLTELLREAAVQRFKSDEVKMREEVSR